MDKLSVVIILSWIQNNLVTVLKLGFQARPKIQKTVQGILPTSALQIFSFAFFYWYHWNYTEWIALIWPAVENYVVVASGWKEEQSKLRLWKHERYEEFLTLELILGMNILASIAMTTNMISYSYDRICLCTVSWQCPIEWNSSRCDLKRSYFIMFHFGIIFLRYFDIIPDLFSKKHFLHWKAKSTFLHRYCTSHLYKKFLLCNGV